MVGYVYAAVAAIKVSALWISIIIFVRYRKGRRARRGRAGRGAPRREPRGSAE